MAHGGGVEAGGARDQVMATARLRFALEARIVERLVLARVARGERAAARVRLHAARRTGRAASAGPAATGPAAAAGQRGLSEHVAAVGVLVDVGGDVLARVAQLRRGVVAADAAVLALAQDLLADARARRRSSEQQDQPAERQQTNHGLPR